MTAIAHDGMAVFYFASAVASVSAPTVANITAATRLPNITAFDLPSSEAEVDTSGVDDIYDTNVIGTSKVGPISLTFKRDDTDESDTWDFLQFRDNGFLIYSPFGAAVAGKKVIVYPVQVGQRRPEGYARNASVKFSVNFAVTDDAELDAVIAA